MPDSSYFTRPENLKIDRDYAGWLSELKQRYRRSQIKAAVKVNSEKLLWNWQMGRDLAIRKVESRWGSGIVEQISLDLRAEFPDERGFSASNLWFMKRWYLFYADKTSSQKLDQAGQEFLTSDKQRVLKLDQLGQPTSDDTTEGLPFPSIFAYVPWRHHIEIIKKSKSVEEAIYYICRTIEGDWSRHYLMERIRENDYRNRKVIPNNFDLHLPAPQSTLAKEIKSELDLGFVTLPPKYNEHQLEDALCRQMTRFLLELGTGFAFVGRQKEIVVAGKSRFIDLLFYHYRLRSFIVVELKAKPFDPEYAGKLNFYVAAVNNLLRTEEDNPTIGLLICSDMNETEVQWSFDSMTNPVGVASYHNIRELNEQLPTIEQLLERIKLLENELTDAELAARPPDE